LVQTRPKRAPPSNSDLSLLYDSIE
jgi:hypothetical protein